MLSLLKHTAQRGLDVGRRFGICLSKAVEKNTHGMKYSLALQKDKSSGRKKTPAQPLFVLCPGTQREGDVVESEAWDLSAIPNRRGNIGKITGNIGKCH